MAVIRYPGSKAKLAAQIREHFPDGLEYVDTPMFAKPFKYREPFFGAGAVGFDLIRLLHRDCPTWLNDKDPDMAALWRTVQGKDSHEALMGLVDRFNPSVDAFNAFKEQDGRESSDLDRAIRKLALHRMSYSGLGYMSGGPLGGQNQSSEYKVGCRWNPSSIKKEIWQSHKRLARLHDVQVTSLDFADVMADADETTFVYLDPPYYEKGPALYKHSMSDTDHQRLASILKDARFQWVLSYDEHPFIRDLYEPWAQIEPIYLTYTMARAKDATRPKNAEVVIRPKAA